jgi:hypothetical protein
VLPGKLNHVRYTPFGDEEQHETSQFRRLS